MEDGGLKMAELIFKEGENTFLNFFDRSPKMKILDVLITGREFEYTLNDVVNASKVNRQNAFNILREMVDLKIIKKAKKVGRLQYYRLNIENEAVKQLIKVYDTILQKYSR